MNDSAINLTGRDRTPMTPHRRAADSRNAWIEIAKFFVPILLSLGGAVWFAQTTMEREIAVVKATEQNHFDEIQRGLVRIESWMARQENAGKK